jgi:hypothetical protein
LFVAVVAAFAQALKRTECEKVPIALVSGDVVGNACGGDAPGFTARPA